MATHIFVTSEENYQICLRKGVAAVPGGKRPATKDQLISRMALIRPNDKILFHVAVKKELCGVFRALEKPFYDETPLWPSHNGERYPFRVRFDILERFPRPLLLSDIYDLRDEGKIWTFSLQRAGGRPNSLFSISEVEFDQVLQLYLKVNQIVPERAHIEEPYRHIEPNILSRLTFGEAGNPKYEATLASLFLNALSCGAYTGILGRYSDYLAYVPTSFQKEIDVLLLHSHPSKAESIIAYTIIELKRDEFNQDGLSQLLMYEDWFLKKRVNGDSRAIRAVAVASSFDQEVIAYVRKREQLEGKRVNLLKYRATPQCFKLELDRFSEETSCQDAGNATGPIADLLNSEDENGDNG